MGHITQEQRDRLLVATLENPPHGLMDQGTVDDLDALVKRADADPEIRAVVLTGAHPTRFAAHYDVREILKAVNAAPSLSRNTAAALLHAVRSATSLPGVTRALQGTPLVGLTKILHLHDLFLRMNRSDVLYVAAINGSTMGGGCELALACDRRIMASGDFVIGQPEVLLGFPPGAGGTQRLARLLGTGKALRIALDGMPLSAQEAHDIGLVDALADPAEVLSTAIAHAERLASRPAAAIAGIKRAVYEGGSLPLAEGLITEAAEFLATAGTRESKALMQRYVEELDRLDDVPAYHTERLRNFSETGRFAVEA
ncbi:enoyl-CoA hydratase/isomerase family protein [Algiphilus sp. NNCM1]|uniref:enoyl-CoA hydratase/isomerase family protein n=1 Tax=Algiphilus sp. TaxID=1872431 RepID=UPI001CA70CD7|nr:enoyl-CoA hydratase/isomerase family protein [Algiphilus acroporae]